MDDEQLSESSFRHLNDIKPLYITPKDPFPEEVLIPSLKVAHYADCMIGFFSSKALSDLAPGLATYINNNKNKFRLIISPFLSEKDREAIENNIKTPDEVLIEVFNDLIITDDALERHTLKCLSYLLYVERIEFKFALLKNALFHPKVWLFQNDEDFIVAHGSSNFTRSGIRDNFEQITVSFSWKDETQKYIIDKLKTEFELLYSGEQDDCIVLDMPDAIKNKILTDYETCIPPQESEFIELYRKASKSDNEKDFSSELIPKPVFKIPDWINYTEGDFKHQGEAVDAWVNNDFNGILEMATGSGKTITSMICAFKLYQEVKPLLIVVAAPYLPLINQWCDEIKEFNLNPINLGEINGAGNRIKKILQLKRKLRAGISDVEILVITHNALCNPDFFEKFKEIDVAKLLIADEVHNLGSEGFIRNPPEHFKYRLGLSATPVRQYDDEGTSLLFNFFKSPVYVFSLKQAIGSCLVEYEYHLHECYLTNEELDDWYELTDKIKQNFWRQEEGKPDDFLSKLLRDRRKLLETAKNKLYKLDELLSNQESKDIIHTLIYSSDKDPEQLKAVNLLLKSKGLLYHQLTADETRNAAKTNAIIKSFENGNIQIITAKRVLDEGVNIPQISKAYILASTTVERQWVQRRGRLLRKCKEIGKTKSIIHDFIALPPDRFDKIDSGLKTLIESELKRVQKFASLAMNSGRKDGPIEIVDRLINLIYS